MIAFILTMPNNNSWNGHWTGESNIHAIVRSIRDKKTLDLIFNGKESASFYYDFEDGWGASISVSKVSAPRGNVLKHASKGFCGYSWMVDEICTLGRIMDRQERIEKKRGATK